MSWQLFNPAAIIIPAPPKAEIQVPSTKKEPLSVEEHYRKIYDTPWNKLQPDGRINIDGKTSASVSPYSEHFRSQVEDGIWPLVEVLYKKGYLPVSSCCGHKGGLLKEIGSLTEYHSGAYVTIAINRLAEAEVMRSLKNLSNRHTEIVVSHTQANMDASMASSIGRIKKLKKQSDLKNEYESLNWMLQRNYEEWSYINIRINPWKRYSLMYALRTQIEDKLISKQVERYKDLPDYLF